MRTIESFEDYVDPIQEAINDLLLPTLSGQTEPLPSDLRPQLNYVICSWEIRRKDFMDCLCRQWLVVRGGNNIFENFKGEKTRHLFLHICKLWLSFILS